MATTQENPKPPSTPPKADEPSGTSDNEEPVYQAGGMFPNAYNPGPFDDGDGKNSDLLKKNVDAAAEALKEREAAEQGEKAVKPEKAEKS